MLGSSNERVHIDGIDEMLGSVDGLVNIFGLDKALDPIDSAGGLLWPSSWKHRIAQNSFFGPQQTDNRCCMLLFWK